MKNKYKIAGFLWLLLTVIVSVTLLSSFNSRKKIPASLKLLTVDSNAFIPNTAGGWSILSSYLLNRGDSVDFELILSRTVPAGNNWSDSTLVGQIDQKFCPSIETVIQYVELPRTWSITIRSSGSCYFKLLSGAAPQGTTVILPVQTRYRKI